MTNHRLKNVQGYLFMGDLPVIVLNEIVGILLLCFSKEIYLFASRCLLRSGGSERCAQLKATESEKRTHHSSSGRERVWHDLCGCVQFSKVERERESYFWVGGQIEHLC